MPRRFVVVVVIVIVISLCLFHHHDFIGYIIKLAYYHKLNCRLQKYISS